MENFSLLDRMSRLGELTPGEAKLAEVLEREASQLAFTNLAQISAKAGVGKSTVTRFLRKLGYENFPDFIQRMRSETMGLLEASPINGYARDKHNQPDSPALVVPLHLERVIRCLERTMELNAPEQMQTALDLLGDPERPIYIIGAATAHSLAHYAFLLLRFIRNRVYLLDGDITTLAHRLSGWQENAVLFAVSFHRFSRVTKTVMKLFHDAGKPVILLTDRHANPLMNYTDCYFVASTEGGEHTLFSSRAAAMALIEGLVSALSPPMNKDVERRFAMMETIFAELGAFDA
ncbi:MAG: hypothetical protein DELT_02678 [Desulfovibrio sp.]